MAGMEGYGAQELAVKTKLVQRNLAPVLAAADRVPQPVRIVGVTKYVDASWCCAAVDAGLTELGENRIGEGAAKYAAVRASGRSLTAHLVGPIQSNKARKVPGAFDFVQALDREKVAAILHQRCEELELELPVLIEVNIDREPQKAGVAPEQAGEFTQWVAANCPRLAVRGLMCIPEWPAGGVVDAEYEHSARESFARMKLLFDELQPTLGASFDTLSMGMSADYQWALEAGATMVRVGRMLWEE